MNILVVEMSNRNTLKYHILLGAILIGMNLLEDLVRQNLSLFLERLWPIGLVYLITFNLAFFATYYVNYQFLCPRTLGQKDVPRFLFGVLGLLLLFSGLRYFLDEVLVYSIAGFHNYGDATRTFWYYIFDNTAYALNAILFSTFMFFLFLYLKTDSQVSQLQLERQKAELSALKTQLEPHFLFNTLNVFYSELAEKEPQTAKGIHKLSELFRYVTYEAQNDFVPLKKELQFIKDYLYFYEKRFENNLFVELEVTGEAKEQRVPSLVLIHFIENIFKHGVTHEKEHPARIGIRIGVGEISLRTENKISTVKNYSVQGIGKENLKKRLLVLFGENHVFKSDVQGELFFSELVIPLKK